MDGFSWKQFTSQGLGPREAAGMTYDSVRERVILFGGAQSGEMMNDIWAWDGNQWIQVSIEGPSPRFPAGLAYDAARQNAVLFGGHAIDGQGIATYGDTWIWDGPTREEFPVTGPSPRDGADVVFFQDSEELLLFGGAAIDSGVTLLNDSWLWDGSQWELVEGEGPPARVHPAMAFDVTGGIIVMTGGSNAPSTVLLETWEWECQVWICKAGC